MRVHQTKKEQTCWQAALLVIRSVNQAYWSRWNVPTNEPRFIE